MLLVQVLVPVINGSCFEHALSSNAQGMCTPTQVPLVVNSETNVADLLYIHPGVLAPVTQLSDNFISSNVGGTLFLHNPLVGVRGIIIIISPT
jgi:hypothetical protein